MRHLTDVADGLDLPVLGLGCMRMSNSRTPQDRAEALTTIHAALDAGVRFLDTGDFYGSGHNELLVGEAIRDVPRDHVFLSVKFGALVGPDGRHYGLDVRPSLVKNYLSYSLERLGVDYVDLYQPCRIDPNIPVEETLGPIGELVAAGRVRHVGLSQVSPDVLRRAVAVCPISLLEINYSVFHRQPETGLLQAAKDLGVGVVAFGLMANGMLNAGKITQMAAINPQFTPADPDGHLAKVAALRRIAADSDMTLPQLLTAWVLAQGGNIMALPGPRTLAQLRDALSAVDVELTPETLARIDQTTHPTTSPAS